MICTFVTPPSSLWPALSANLYVYCCVLQSFSRLCSEELPSQQGILSLKVSSCCYLGCWHSEVTLFAACPIHSLTHSHACTNRIKFHLWSRLYALSFFSVSLVTCFLLSLTQTINLRSRFTFFLGTFVQSS